LVATHLVHTALPRGRCEVVFIDTSTCHPKTYDYVHHVAKLYGWELKVLRPKKSYDEYVERWGFPHAITYRWCMRVLKLEPIKEYVKGKDVINCTGIRKDESVRRLMALRCVKEFDNVKGRLMLAPIISWSKRDVESYIHEHDLPRNDSIWRTFHFSGDCFCMAWPKKFTLQVLRHSFPEMYQRLVDLEDHVLRNKNYTIVRGMRASSLKQQELLSLYICPCTEVKAGRSTDGHRG